MLSHHTFWDSTVTNVSINPSADMLLRVDPGSSHPGYLNYMKQFNTVFRYWRGGVRVVSVPVSTDNCVGTDLVISSNPYTSLITATVPIFGDPVKSSSAFSYHPSTTRIPVDVIIPYNSRLNCKLTCQNTPASYEGNIGPTMEYRTFPTTSTFTNLFIAGADDYRLGFQLGIPTCTTVIPS